jgi:hypothetical protein
MATGSAGSLASAHVLDPDVAGASTTPRLPLLCGPHHPRGGVGRLTAPARSLLHALKTRPGVCGEEDPELFPAASQTPRRAIMGVTQAWQILAVAITAVMLAAALAGCGPAGAGSSLPVRADLPD